jgi:hypothetical protein
LVFTRQGGDAARLLAVAPKAAAAIEGATRYGEDAYVDLMPTEIASGIIRDDLGTFERSIERIQIPWISEIISSRRLQRRLVMEPPMALLFIATVPAHRQL